MLNSCAKAPNGLPPFFLTVSMMENIQQKLDPPSAERNEPAVFILSLLMRKERSAINPIVRINRLVLNRYAVASAQSLHS